MKTPLSEEKIAAIVEALDEALKKGPWEQSNFLRVIGKNITKIRNDFVNQSQLSPTLEKALDFKPMLADKQTVYIVLYNAEGNNLNAWEKILANLPRQILFRPIYAEEATVQYRIKNKENNINEAYVAIEVHSKDILILAEDKLVKDKFGNSLLTLKEKTLTVENIIQFVHTSGVYSYKKGRLVKTSL